MIDDNIIYIYALCEPETGKVRYVGKTVDLQTRYQNHINETRNDNKNLWIQSLKAIGLKPTLKVLEILTNPTEEEWQFTEKFWMNQFSSNDLFNMREGGNGGAHKAESRLKMSVGRSHKTEGEAHYRAKLTNSQVIEIRTMYAAGVPKREIAEKFGATRFTVTDIVLGRSWKHVGGPITFVGKGQRVLPRVHKTPLTERKRAILEGL